ncbi:hypothetical protein SAY86_011087 [Trapa natans]|uniref:NAC domain-containing protein n=1 Tax=Trapa natans TaxID=22666 RepID=A0AAN7LLJ6_TRANT|nr:hypothetical protein SAY86_011087 [Trapa natans]
MCPPAAAPLTDEELIKLLDKLQHGFPFPENVITEVNPYCYQPDNLPGDEILYLVRSEETRRTESGIWELKEKACCVFKDKSITGWRTTLVFFEGQTHCSREKTDWIMQEFRITSNDLGKNIHESKVHENIMLCRVFRTGAGLTDQDGLLSNYDVDPSFEKSFQSIPLGLLNTESRFEKGSSSNHQENNESNKGKPESPPTVAIAGNLPENDFISGDDYIELWDLGDPASRTSSSDNSSCMTMSSDAQFDVLALLGDMEPRIHQIPVSRNTNFFLGTSSEGPDRITIGTASGSLIIQEPFDFPHKGASRADLPSTSSATGKKKRRESSNKNPSPNSHEVSPSSSSQSSESEGSKSGKGRIKGLKKKYQCIFPFQFLF